MIAARRHRKDGVVNQIFPVTGKASFRGHGGEACPLFAAVGGKNELVQFVDVARGADGDAFDAERHRRFDEAEAGGVVVGGDTARHNAPGVVGKLDRVGFENQIADRQHQAGIGQQHAAAFALAPQRPAGTGVLQRSDLEFDDIVERRHHGLRGALFSFGRAGSGCG